jgi:hypothetical protein
MGRAMKSNTRVDHILGQLEHDHLRLLRVCRDYPKDGNGTFCGRWIKSHCEHEGVPFHQGWLRKLANLDLLEREDSSRGGNRRYYRIKDAALIQEVLGMQPA